MGRQCCGRESKEPPPLPQAKVTLKLPGQSSQQSSLQERQYIPAEDMGDYEEYKKKKGPKKSGPLYPLNEEVVPPFSLSKIKTNF